ncbi:hypothetical protein NDU88_004454 [Pleurodeles waltl]|uniref:Uncharacterized protein n=1 Tax=Pleurodeles waltl TaxID=8319 RepID=A0AAV7TS10_PLEWA|nr:hypothetical protein NDU88_004454 [Pleurodeles waltl]
MAAHVVLTVLSDSSNAAQILLCKKAARVSKERQYWLGAPPRGLLFVQRAPMTSRQAPRLSLSYQHEKRLLPCSLLYFDDSFF